jgi:hypothetical protein
MRLESRRIRRIMMRSGTRLGHEDDQGNDAQVRLDAALRAKSPQERLSILDGMWRSASRMIAHRLRLLHPEWTDAEVARETARRLSHGAV